MYLAEDVNHVKRRYEVLVEFLASLSMWFLCSQTRVTISLLETDIEVPDAYET